MEEEEEEEDEEEEEEMEEEVDQNFRLELMKVLQQQNALVGVEASRHPAVSGLCVLAAVQQFNCCKHSTDVTNITPAKHQHNDNIVIASMFVS